MIHLQPPIWDNISYHWSAITSLSRMYCLSFVRWLAFRFIRHELDMTRLTSIAKLPGNFSRDLFSIRLEMSTTPLSFLIKSKSRSHVFHCSESWGDRQTSKTIINLQLSQGTIGVLKEARCYLEMCLSLVCRCYTSSSYTNCQYGKIS